VAACVLGYATLSRRPPNETSPRTQAVSLPRLSPRDVALVLLALAVFAPTLAWLYTQWTISVFRNGHGLFIPS
jgi:hypothetical protein